MREPYRLGATFVIWAALTIILTSTNSNLEGVGSVFIVLAAMGSTIAVWASGINMGNQRNDVVQAAEKSKRNSRDRLAKLVQQMDDDEIAQLGDLLSQNDDSARYNERLSR
jgi:hypothetical protein